MLRILPCLDTDEIAESRRRELDLRPSVAAALGLSAVEAAEKGYYVHSTDHVVDWSFGEGGPRSEGEHPSRRSSA